MTNDQFDLANLWLGPARAGRAAKAEPGATARASGAALT
jgi:hypothetical protein